ncbi:MAG: hypothetical protein ACRCV5_23735, partial [Afipia sp.]
WIDNKGFSLTHDNDEYFKASIAILTCFISALIMQSLTSLKGISRISKWDISLYCYTIQQIIMSSTAPEGTELAEAFPRMKARAALLPTKPRRFKANG